VQAQQHPGTKGVAGARCAGDALGRKLDGGLPNVFTPFFHDVYTFSSSSDAKDKATSTRAHTLTTTVMELVSDVRFRLSMRSGYSHENGSLTFSVPVSLLIFLCAF
jgi:hypothetical protein